MDYYLKTTSKEAFLQDLQRAGIQIEMPENYYQDQNTIIDWIGKIPLPIQIDEEGEPIGEIQYYEGEHINIRSINEIDITKFENTQDVHPNIPYRMFS